MNRIMIVRTLNFLMVTALPLLSGCNGGGGGGGAVVGGLFGASSDGGSTLGGLSDGGAGVGGAVGGASLASIHNPEPTTMLLVGGGMMAIAYFRNRQN